MFGKICLSNAGQMHGHLHLRHCIFRECVYAEVNALLVRSDITGPLSVYHSYQHTSVITLAASLACPSHRLNFTDKVLLHSLQ